MTEKPTAEYVFQESKLLEFQIKLLAHTIGALYDCLTGDAPPIGLATNDGPPVPIVERALQNELETQVVYFEHLLKRGDRLAADCYKVMSTDMSRDDKIIFAAGHETEQTVTSIRQDLDGVKEYLEGLNV